MQAFFNNYTMGYVYKISCEDREELDRLQEFLKDREGSVRYVSYKRIVSSVVREKYSTTYKAIVIISDESVAFHLNLMFRAEKYPSY